MLPLFHRQDLWNKSMTLLLLPFHCKLLPRCLRSLPSGTLFSDNLAIKFPPNPTKVPVRKVPRCQCGMGTFMGTSSHFPQPTFCIFCLLIIFSREKVAVNFKKVLNFCDQRWDFFKSSHFLSPRFSYVVGQFFDLI